MASHDSSIAHTCTFERPGLQNTTKIQREDTQRGKKRTNFAAGEGKKERHFGRSRGRAVPGAPNMTHATHKHTNPPHTAHTQTYTNTHKHTQPQVELGLAKVGLAKVGRQKGWPKSVWPKSAMTSRRPAHPRDPLPDELTSFVPERIFDFDQDQFCRNLRSSRRGAGHHVGERREGLQA